MAKKSFTNVKYGYGTIGVNVFFSIADIYRLGDIIANIQRSDEAKEYAIRDLMYLYDKLVTSVSSAEDSLFNPQTDGEDEL